MTSKRVNLACPLDRPVLAIGAEVHLSGGKAGSREEPPPIEIPIDEKRLRIARDDVKQFSVVGRRSAPRKSDFVRGRDSTGPHDRRVRKMQPFPDVDW